MSYSRQILIVLCIAGLAFAGNGYGQSAEALKLEDAALALEAFQEDPATAIPPGILQNAQGVAVLPGVIRGGLVLGGRRGKGIAVIRSQSGEWSNPLFITMTGVSLGAQLGAESADLVLVFGNRRSVHNIGAGKFTMTGDASATAGPVGRGARRATDMSFTSEVYFYARSRGLFAGAVLGGANLGVDEAANRHFYPPEGGVEPLSEPSPATPAGARQFLSSLARAQALAPARPAPPEAVEEAEIYPLGAQPP